MSEDEDTVTYAHREWLNKESTMTGTMSTFVEVWKHDRGYIEASVEIRDCSRSVNLDFSLKGNEKELNRSLEKIDNILKMLEQFRAEILSVYPTAKENFDEWLAKKEARDKEKAENERTGSSVEEVLNSID